MSNAPIKVALVQMTSGLDVDANAAFVRSAIAQGAAQGATLISTPEMTNFLAKGRAEAFARAVPESEDTVLQSAIDAAKTHRVWVHLGSLCIALGGDMLANRTLVITPNGDVTARYDKLHMFDVDLGAGEVYKESALYQQGDYAVTAEMCGAVCGLSICYDLRFAALYQTLAQAGAKILFIPAAFTQPTGEAHWETLLRARAIETGCYVIAAGQTGTHESGRKTHGHSMVIDPWGRVLESLERQPGILYASLDLQQVEEARRKLPSLSHSRTFDLLEA